MQSRAHRPERSADDVGDPVERQVQVVVQDHHRSVIEGEASEATVELVTDLQAAMGT